MKLSWVSGLFAFLFVYTATMKLLDVHQFEVALRQHPVIGPFAPLLSILIPCSELLIAILLLFHRFRRQGLWMATALVALFTMYLALMLLLAKDLPCHCGGVIGKLTWKQHLALNLFFIGIGVWGLRAPHRRTQNQSDQR